MMCVVNLVCSLFDGFSHEVSPLSSPCAVCLCFMVKSDRERKQASDLAGGDITSPLKPGPTEWLKNVNILSSLIDAGPEIKFKLARSVRMG